MNVENLLSFFNELMDENCSGIRVQKRDKNRYLLNIEVVEGSPLKEFLEELIDISNELDREHDTREHDIAMLEDLFKRNY